jgi:nucleoside-diphosphate-sugar epimerase
VRSDDKGQRILESHKGLPESKLSYRVVEDIAKEGAFDHVVVSDPPFEAVVHTASPFHYNVNDSKTDFLDPAIAGTTGILRAVKAKAPGVKRVVITSSFASIVNPKLHPAIYSEANWSNVTMDDALADRSLAYRASKTLAERAAWDFVKNENPNFELSTLCPPMVFGPMVHYVASLDAVNTSNARIRDMVDGKMKDQLAPSTIFIWIDVRDLAVAHVNAIELSEAAGKRIFVTAGYYSNKEIAESVKRHFPEYKNNFPPGVIESDMPKDIYKYDNRQSREILKMDYRTLDECVRDTVVSLNEIRARQAALSETPKL